MAIIHNMLAMNSNRMLGLTNKNQAKSTERLSSGYRINRAADDAAGLSISEKMRKQIRGLTQAARNCQDGISMVQTAEGVMNEMHAMVQRGNELAIKAANGTLSDNDRALVDQEVQELMEAMNGMVEQAEFNELKLFPGNGIHPTKSVSSSAITGGENYHYDISFNLASRNMTITTDVETANAADGISVGTGQYATLADKIANELIPNALEQIMDAFPSLNSAMAGKQIDMTLDISYIDGPSGTLAYAQYSFYQSGGEAMNFLVKVDTSDFDDNDATSSGDNAEVLESTIAHELMHSVMQYTMTDEMSGRDAGIEEFPTWFKEGTAQLSGGGYTTGWNSWLTYYASNLSSATDTSQDANIANYLQSYTVEGRPYGHGYLASAYIGYLSYKNNGGTGGITSENIAAGMDKVFSDILNGTSMTDAIKNNTGITDIEALFSSGDADLVDFVRQLSFLSQGGAGSVVATSLSVGGTDILDDTASVDQPFKITKVLGVGDTGSVAAGNEPNIIHIQAGAESGVQIEIPLYNMNTKVLGLAATNVRTEAAATQAIDEFAEAIHIISKVRSDYGAIQNRLEHTINNLDNVVENTTEAESRIRDTDMAEAMVEYSNNNILLQAGQSMLAQSNKYNEFVLQLLG